MRESRMQGQLACPVWRGLGRNGSQQWVNRAPLLPYIIIRRTLVYAVLTGLLALAYFVSIVVLQNILSVLTGQSQSTLVTVLSTLGVSVLVLPLRARVQAVIDRRLYRSKYDAARTLAAFGATLRDETNLGQLQDHLIKVVDETMQPSSVALWLVSRPAGRTPEGSPNA